VNVKSKSFEDLIVWQKAHQWVLNIYTFTKEFPREELFGLTSQMRRAAVSITANIAEGFKRKGYADKAKFYNTAQSSLEECRYYLILSNDLKLGNCEKLMEDLEIISKLLEKYYTSVCKLTDQ
jgi:four helix bundle protein